MKTIGVTSNLLQVTRLRSVNAFLVREEDGFTLVDTTTSGVADDLIQAAERAGGEIRRIALTHGHGDHAGSVDALRARLGSTVPVMIPAVDARVLAGERVIDGKKVRGGWPKVSTQPDVLLGPGDRVGSLEVVPSPGHSPGHVAFLDTRDRTLIAGDTLTSFGRVTVSNGFNLPFPLAGLSTWDKAMNMESAKALRALEPTTLVVGHGPPNRDPVKAMDAAIAKAGG